MVLLNILFIILFIVTSFTVLYSFIFSVAGFFSFNKQYKSGETFKKIAVFIPCHKNDAAILHSAEHALFQKYPSHRYDVVVIGDRLLPQTVESLKKLPIKFVESNYDISIKARALKTAFQTLKDNYDIAVILDADNTMRPDFLDKINAAFVNGCYAVQGHKVSRADKSNVGILESMSNEINNHIFRKGHQAMHLSSAVTGSGIAFSYEYLRLVVEEMEMKKGFDKELELELVEDNHRIVYLDDAIIIDENNQDEVRFIHQRADWIRNQFAFFKNHFMRGFLSVIFGRYDYANKIAHFALVPKVILLCVLLIVSAITSFDIKGLIIGLKGWTILSALYIAALLLAVPFRFYRLNTLMAIATLPWNLVMIFKDIFTTRLPATAISEKENALNFDNQATEK